MIANDCQLRVVLMSDRSTAELRIPAAFDRNLLTPEVCSAVLRDAGVEVTGAVMGNLDRMLTTLASTTGDVSFIVAHAIEPRHGRDGTITWIVEDDPAQQDVAFYDRSSYTMVTAGQVLAQIAPPTNGEDGRDVTGRVLAARNGRCCVIKIGTGVICKENGDVIAENDGALMRSADRVDVVRLISVTGCVDFSTGNIDFEGDVVVHRGVRDRFVIHAGGHVDVRGLVESAAINAGGDVVLRGGMAGRDIGNVRCGGDLEARYLDKVTGSIGRNLTFEREVIGCTLGISGRIEAPMGTIIGGTMTVASSVRVYAIGSDAGTATQIYLGKIPGLDEAAANAGRIADAFEARHRELSRQRDELRRSVLTKGADVEERLRLIESAIHSVTINMGKACQAVELLAEKRRARLRVDLRVEHMIYRGTRLVIGCNVYEFQHDVHGPLHIINFEGAVLVTQRDAASVSLESICRRRPATTSPDDDAAAQPLAIAV